MVTKSFIFVIHSTVLNLILHDSLHASVHQCGNFSHRPQEAVAKLDGADIAWRNMLDRAWASQLVFMSHVVTPSLQR
jgi:hypothetical protein